MDYICSAYDKVCECPHEDKNYLQFLEMYMMLSFGAMAFELSRKALLSFTYFSKKNDSFEEILVNLKEIPCIDPSDSESSDSESDTCCAKI